MRTILRLWGAFVYERVGQYPETQLASYDRPLGPISDVITQVGAGPGWLPWVLLVLMVVVWLGWITPSEIGLSSRQVAQVPQGVIAPVTPTATPLPKPAGPTPTIAPTPQPTALYVVRVLDSQPVRDSGALRIREARNTKALLVDSATTGEPLTVYQRVTEGNTTWLWVESPRGKRGWVRENQDGTLLVARPDQVTPTPSNTLTPEPSATPTSTSTPAETPIAALRPTPTALAVNVLAKVTPPEGAKLKVRDKPSVAGRAWRAGPGRRHLLDLDVPRELLNYLTWVVTVQRVQTLCPKCKQPETVIPARWEELRHRFPNVPLQGTFFRAGRCAECDHTGRKVWPLTRARPSSSTT